MPNKNHLSLRRAVPERIITSIVTALGLVASLAWNEAIKDLINYVFPFGADSLLAKFLYALIITIFTVALTVELTRLIHQDEEDTQPKHQL